ERLLALRRFLDSTEYADAERERLAGDASSRAYERLAHGDRRLILMNAPRRPDGPPVRHGKPYSAIAHLAEDVKSFVAIANGLRERGFTAPAIHDFDLAEGLIVLEDLGNQGVVGGDPPGPIEVCYQTAVDALVALHALTLPETLPVAPGVTHVIPPYAIAPSLTGAGRRPACPLPYRGAPADVETRATFTSLWRDALAPVVAAPRTWVLRDFHSPNLLWLPERSGIGKVGILDFQD